MASAHDTPSNAANLRIDKLLWYLRLAASRSMGRTLAEQGHIRLNGRRIDRAHAPVRSGDRLTLMVHGQIRVIEMLHLPHRRGPAPEAQACYRIIDATDA